MRIPVVIRSVLLFITGSLMAAVLIRNDFWLFLHPKLRFFSLSAAALIIVSSIVSAVLSKIRPKKWYFIVFILFIGMFVVGFTGKTGKSAAANRAAPETGAALGENDPGQEWAAPDSSTAVRFTYREKEYVPINLGELYLLSKFDDQLLIESRFAVRGIVKRRLKYDEKKQILIARVAVTCCLADATVLLYRVGVPEPEAFTDGEWVLVLGHVQKETIDENEIPDEIKVDEIRYFAIEGEHIMAADVVKKANPPAVPYMFQFKTEEPFAF